MCDYTFFSKDPSWWDESYQSLWGCHNICPPMKQFHIAQITQPELSSLTHLWVWGDSKRFCSDVAFLLVLPQEGVAGERVYGLTIVWVHPYQARVSTIDDVARKLILLTSSMPNWPYMFMQFNRDACHVPLPKEGHLSAMTEGKHSNIPCGRICQLEVHQLLHSGAQVVYPKGLNGCLVLVITSLLESLSHSMTVLNDKTTFLQVDLSHRRNMSPRPHFSMMIQPLLPHMPCYGTTPQSRESNQHDHGGQWTPITGSSGHLWSSIREFHPKKTSIHGLGSPISSWAGGSHQTSGHLLSGIPVGECSRRCGARWSNPWGDLWSPFPSSWNSGTWCQCPPWGCDSTPRGGQQAIRMPIGN